MPNGVDHSEDRHIVVSDGGRGHSGPQPSSPQKPPAQTTIETIGLDYHFIKPVFEKHGEDAVRVALALRRAGFTTFWIHELFDQIGILGPTILKSILDSWPIPKG